MSEVALRTMPCEAVAAVRELETCQRALPQVDIDVEHLLHAGMYARTIVIPAGVVLTGALIKRATILVLSGDASVYVGGETVRITGYRVLAGSAGRKQAFFSHADTWLTMLFPSSAKAVGDAEREFTDEPDLLMTRGSQHITITGEQ